MINMIQNNQRYCFFLIPHNLPSFQNLAPTLPTDHFVHSVTSLEANYKHFPLEPQKTLYYFFSFYMSSSTP